MTIKAALFDLDGTVADTLPMSYEAFRAVFRTYDDRYVTEEEIVSMFGPTEDTIIQRNLRNRNAVAEAAQTYYTVYKEGHAHDGQLAPHIKVMLQELKLRGIRLGIVTGKSKQGYTISSDALQLSGYFDVIVTGEDVSQPKPHPEGIQKALSMLGVQPSEAIFLGDSDADIQAGKAAGLRTYGVKWIPTHQSLTKAVSPDRVFTSTAPFLDLVRGDV